MVMKISNDEFLKRLKDRNIKFEPLEEYNGYNTNILCRCKECGHVWAVRPGNILSGKGCPNCMKIKLSKTHGKTHNNFMEEVLKKNPDVVPIENYKGAKKKILVRCKMCSYEWQARPDHILNGHGCPICGGSQKKENELFLSQLSSINSMIEPLETYVNSKNKILCRCKYCLHEWKVSPGKLLLGSGCPNCDSRNKTSFPEQAIYYYLKKVYKGTKNRYYFDDDKMELDIFVPEIRLGIEYDGAYWHKSKGEKELIKYKKCKEKNITLYRVRESDLQIDNIADKVIIRKKPYNFNTLNDAIIMLLSKLNLDMNVSVSDDANKIREQFYTNLTDNSLLNTYPNVSSEWNVDKNGKITPKMISYGSNDVFWWICSNCGHEWKATVADRTVGGKGCPMCARRKLSKKYSKSHETFIIELNSVNKNVEALEKYKTAHEKILMRCKICNNKWFASPANLLNGRGCPKCSMKKRNAKLK